MHSLTKKFSFFLNLSRSSKCTLIFQSQLSQDSSYLNKWRCVFVCYSSGFIEILQLVFLTYVNICLCKENSYQCMIRTNWQKKWKEETSNKMKRVEMRKSKKLPIRRKWKIFINFYLVAFFAWFWKRESEKWRKNCEHSAICIWFHLASQSYILNEGSFFYIER